MNQPYLSLWERVIFVDWHGVMSSDPFWESVLAQRTRLGSSLRNHLSHIFRSDSAMVHNWMRGELSTSDVVEPTRRHLGNNRNADFLERRILEDCRLMSVDRELTMLFASLRDRALIVLATDNTYEFEAAFRAAKNTSRCPVSQVCDSGEMTLNQAARNFDDILCSASLGVLKSESPQRFFGDWLARNSLRFGDALLIDDRQDNCEAFRELGGHTIKWDDASLARHSRLARIREFVESSQGEANLDTT